MTQPEYGPIEERRLDELRPHPEQASIFGDPTADPSFPELLSSLRKHGQSTPLLIKADGTILCGHARVAALDVLKRATADVRVVTVENYRAEIELMIRDNTDRKQLTDRQKAFAFNRLRTLAKEDGGTKPKHGGDRKSERAKVETDQAPPGRGLNRSKEPAAEDAAATLGISADTGRRLEEVFIKEDVPEPVKAAVDAGQVAVKTAAEAIKTERKRQGGEITDPVPLAAWAEEKAAKKAPVTPLVSVETGHEERIRREAEAFRKDIAKLTEVYRDLSTMVARRPLTSVTGYNEHHEYLGLLRDIGLCALTQVENANGTNNNGGRQMRLVSNNGEKK